MSEFPTEFHVCKCGCAQTECPTCGEWTCNATGHVKHVCAQPVDPRQLEFE